MSIIDVDQDENYVDMFEGKQPTISKRYVDLNTGECEEDIHEETFLHGVLPGVEFNTHYVDGETIHKLVEQNILPDKEVYAGQIWGVIWFNAEDYAKELEESLEVDRGTPDWPHSEY